MLAKKRLKTPLSFVSSYANRCRCVHSRELSSLNDQSDMKKVITDRNWRYTTDLLSKFFGKLESQSLHDIMSSFRRLKNRHIPIPLKYVEDAVEQLSRRRQEKSITDILSQVELNRKKVCSISTQESIKIDKYIGRSLSSILMRGSWNDYLKLRQSFTPFCENNPPVLHGNMIRDVIANRNNNWLLRSWHYENVAYDLNQSEAYYRSILPILSKMSSSFIHETRVPHVCLFAKHVDSELEIIERAKKDFLDIDISASSSVKIHQTHLHHTLHESLKNTLEVSQTNNKVDLKKWIDYFKVENINSVVSELPSDPSSGDLFLSLLNSNVLNECRNSDIRLKKYDCFIEKQMVLSSVLKRYIKGGDVDKTALTFKDILSVFISQHTNGDVRVMSSEDVNYMIKNYSSLFSHFDYNNFMSTINAHPNESEMSTYHSNRQEKVMALGTQLLKIFQELNLYAPPSFFHSWLDGLCPREKTHWNAYASVSQTISCVQAICEKGGDTLMFENFPLNVVVTMLCRMHQPDGVFEALRFYKQKSNQAVLSREAFEQMIKSARLHLSGGDLVMVINRLARIASGSSYFKLSLEPQIVREFLLANVRLGKLQEALFLLRRCRQNGPILTMKDYEELMELLSRIHPKNQESMQLLVRPLKLIAYFLVEMKRDNVKLTPNILNSMTKLFYFPILACKVPTEKQMLCDKMIHRAMDFVTDIGKQSCLGFHPKIGLNAQIICSLSGIYARFGFPEKSYQFVAQSLQNHGMEFKSEAIHEAVRGWALLGSTKKIEDVIVSIVSQNRTLTSFLVSSLGKSHLMHRRFAEANEAVMETYRMYNVRPTPHYAVSALEIMIQNGKIDEANQWVQCICQLWTESERRAIATYREQDDIATRIDERAENLHYNHNFSAISSPMFPFSRNDESVKKSNVIHLGFKRSPEHRLPRSRSRKLFVLRSPCLDNASLRKIYEKYHLTDELSDMIG